MRPELASIIAELDTATDHAKAIATRAGDEYWKQRPAPDRWSVGECFDHLNRSSEAYFPIFEQALQGAPTAKPGGLRRDFLGWLLCVMLEPPVRIKTKTSGRFVPPIDVAARAEVMDRFELLQDHVKQFIMRSDSVDVASIKIKSPFAEKLQYGMYSAFRVLPVHQRRHLWQAERVLDSLEST
jgi:hypothetical protein